MKPFYFLLYRQRKNGKFSAWDYYETESEAYDNKHFADAYDVTGSARVVKYMPAAKPMPKGRKP